MLEVPGGNKDEVGDTQRWCSITGTAGTSQVITRLMWELGDIWRKEKSWAMLDPDLDSLWFGQKIGLCEKQALVNNGWFSHLGHTPMHSWLAKRQEEVPCIDHSQEATGLKELAVPIKT